MKGRSEISSSNCPCSQFHVCRPGTVVSRVYNRRRSGGLGRPEADLALFLNADLDIPQCISGDEQHAAVVVRE